MTKPEHLTLRDLIAVLAREEDRDRVVPVGFRNPHLYGGYYGQLAFELAENVRIGDMLAAAQSAVGATYQGWKGEDFTMHGYSDCWLVEREGRNGETLGRVLLMFMLAAGADQ
jgi:hypothetical protein